MPPTTSSLSALPLDPEFLLLLGRKQNKRAKGIRLPSSFSWGWDIMQIESWKKRGGRGRERAERELEEPRGWAALACPDRPGYPWHGKETAPGTEHRGLTYVKLGFRTRFFQLSWTEKTQIQTYCLYSFLKTDFRPRLMPASLRIFPQATYSCLSSEEMVCLRLVSFSSSFSPARKSRLLKSTYIYF